MNTLYFIALFTNLFLCIHSDDYNKNIKDESDLRPKVDGSPANLFDVHFQVAILEHPYNMTYCGGALISFRAVLTAASCVDGRSPEDFVVFAGLTRLNYTKPDGTTTMGQSRRISEIIVHEDFNTAKEHDIALLILSTPFVKDVGVIPIKWRTDEIKPTEWCEVSGFGYDSDGKVNTLRSSTVTRYSRADCQKYYPVSLTITMRMLCYGEYICQGDMGGPLVCNDKLAGIAFYGDGCTKPATPGVFTVVSKYSKWIVKNESHSVKASLVGAVIGCVMALLYS